MAFVAAESLSDEDPGSLPGPRFLVTFFRPILAKMTSSDLKIEFAQKGQKRYHSNLLDALITMPLPQSGFSASLTANH